MNYIEVYENYRNEFDEHTAFTLTVGEIIAEFGSMKDVKKLYYHHFNVQMKLFDKELDELRELIVNEP